LETRAAPPPTEAAEVAGLTLDGFGQHQRVTQAIGNFGEARAWFGNLRGGDFGERRAQKRHAGEVGLVIDRVAEIDDVIVVRDALIGGALRIGVAGASERFDSLGRDRQIRRMAVAGVIDRNAELAIHDIEIVQRLLLDIGRTETCHVPQQQP
jgi:hypothetical protein